MRDQAREVDALPGEDCWAADVGTGLRFASEVPRRAWKTISSGLGTLKAKVFAGRMSLAAKDS